VIATGDREQRAGDCEVEGIGVAWRHDRRTGHGLERRGIAEIEPGQQRGTVQKEGGDRHDGRYRGRSQV
jgi:hypothetical protein